MILGTARVTLGCPLVFLRSLDTSGVCVWLLAARGSHSVCLGLRSCLRGHHFGVKGHHSHHWGHRFCHTLRGQPPQACQILQVGQRCLLTWVLPVVLLESLTKALALDALGYLCS